MNKQLNENDVRLLASFLMDNSPQTVKLAKSHLMNLLRLHPSFRQTLENIHDSKLGREIEMFLEEFRLVELETAFLELFKRDQKLDLELGMVLISNLAYPSVRSKDISHSLDALAGEVDQILDKKEASPQDSCHILRHFLFDQMGFKGNARSYYDPDNSYLNKVLQRRLGIPISLSCVFMFIARRLELPVIGIGLPGHFIVAYKIPHDIIYIDPYDKGRILSLKDCDALVRRQGLTLKEEFLVEATPRQILVRMILNLSNIYTENRDHLKAIWLSGLIEKTNKPSY